MVFVQNNLNPIGGQSRPRKSIPQGDETAAGGAMWSYFHPSDNLATIKGSGYFNDVADLLSRGDCIMYNLNDGTTAADQGFFWIADITSAGVVTTLAADVNNA